MQSEGDYMLRRLKRILGLCECDKCWKRSYANMGIDVSGEKSINRNICESHMHEILKDSELKSITVEV